MRSLTMLFVLLAGCLRSTSYQCEQDTQCGANGHCEQSVGGYCSRDSSDCDSGRVFTETAGPFAGQCVGDQNPPNDGGPDDVMTDGGPFVRCADLYAPIANGQAGHQYRLIPLAEKWDVLAPDCRDDANPAAYRSYLAIPDSPDEMAAIAAFIPNAGNFWVGINDKQTPNTYITEKNEPWAMPYPVPFDTNEPTGGVNDQCLGGHNNTKKLFDDQCNSGGARYRAVCECEPL